MRKNQGDKSYRVINKSHAVIVAADRCNPVQAWTTRRSEQKGDPKQTEAPGGHTSISMTGMLVREQI